MDLGRPSTLEILTNNYLSMNNRFILIAWILLQVSILVELNL